MNLLEISRPYRGARNLKHENLSELADPLIADLRRAEVVDFSPTGFAQDIPVSRVPLSALLVAKRAFDLLVSLSLMPVLFVTICVPT